MLNLTRQERLVIQFLALFFLIGSGIHLYRKNILKDDSIKFLNEEVEAREFRDRAKQIDSVYFSAETVAKEEKPISDETTAFLKINLNSASAEDFMRLPKIGKVTAQRIIDYRNKHGRFSSIDELLNVKGIGEKTFERIKGEVTIE
ncbi:MAG: helix-hairpin-helix domain-containing protein [Candidatus Marinimicrobia bacterium]|nr:helix-hairpin-helix domain-containing protein [Candidatus Neomarinimicrobiota bacterium]